MTGDEILERAVSGADLTEEQALHLLTETPLAALMEAADRIRRQLHPGTVVTWQIDRNVNITNACVSGCKFCNFHCQPSQKEQIYITTIEEYSHKIEEMLALGGDQLLLQGGMHPHLDIEWYENLFRTLKKRYPTVKLHALGPPEIHHIARISHLGIDQTLDRLIAAGLESLPGAGAEILDNEVRRRISPGKCSADRWLEVMGEAHHKGLVTSATMMYGHVETPRQVVQHLIRIRDLQAQCPAGKPGFVAFIPWIFRSSGTQLEREGICTEFSAAHYLRIIALSRLVLNNIPNIQASWLTVGVKTAQMALHGGANDLGSIMIEENVVSKAGADNRLDAEGMKRTIREAGFTPRLRDQAYHFREEPITTR